MTAFDSMSYCFRSFVSVSAFPLKRRRWLSAEGAEEEDLATSDFRSLTVSVSCAVTVMVREGLSDLTVRVMYESGFRSATGWVPLVRVV